MATGGTRSGEVSPCGHPPSALSSSSSHPSMHPSELFAPLGGGGGGLAVASLCDELVRGKTVNCFKKNLSSFCADPHFVHDCGLGSWVGFYALTIDGKSFILSWLSSPQHSKDIHKQGSPHSIEPPRPNPPSWWLASAPGAPGRCHSGVREPPSLGFCRGRRFAIDTDETKSCASPPFRVGVVPGGPSQ